VEEAWSEIDEAERLEQNQKDYWVSTLPTKKEREEIFINSGSVTETEAEDMRREYLKVRFTGLIKSFYENKETEVPAELKKIFSEYNFRFEGGSGITDEQIDQAHNYPIGRLVEVKRGFIACPFHNEKTPSMHITGNKFYCHGCSEGGNTIKFVMKTQGLKFKEAVKYLISL
jgi:hypothetical protein